MIEVDSRDFEHFSRAIRKLPDEIKAKAFARAARRVTEMARTQIVRRNAERVKVPKKVVRELTTAKFNAGGHTQEFVIRSGWIPLYKLGATQTGSGVRVRLRGSYKAAFIATMKSGHTGVMKREGARRLPIRELFGPNPAHDITNNPDEYLEILARVIQEHMLPRVVHELGRILPK